MKNNGKTQDGLMPDMASNGKKPFIDLSFARPEPQPEREKDMIQFLNGFLYVEGFPSYYKEMIGKLAVFYLTQKSDLNTTDRVLVQQFYDRMTSFLDELNEYHYDRGYPED